MKNCSRWVLWGILGSIILAAALAIVLWLARPSGLPDDAVLVPSDIPSLQEALDHALPGTTIVVQTSAGPIQGPILIAVSDITLMSSSSRIRLDGVGEDPALLIRADGVIVRGFDITSESIGVQVDASDCTIEDLQINSAPVGIQLNQAARCVLQSIKTHGGSIGVKLIGSSSVSAENLTITGAAEYGVRLLGSWNNSLKNLSLSGNAVGISIEGASTDNVVEASDIEFSSIAGIEIRGSNDNLLIDSTLNSVRIGIMLEAVTGTEIRRCEVRATTVSGVLLQQAIQNRILETQIDGGQGTGIQLTQSAENALLANDISDCSQGGIFLISSNKNLVMGNEIENCSIGIQTARSNGTRILRNTVLDSGLCGFLVSLGRSNRLLDNVSIDGAYGMILAGSGANTLLRNMLSEADRAGLLLINTLGENHVTENDVRASTWGMVFAATTRDHITQNRVRDNEIGILLVELGSGIRIEGNTIAGNVIGLKQQAKLVELDNDLDALGVVLSHGDESTVPFLANNVFMDNAAFDIQNDTKGHLLAAGNWWGEDSARDSSAAVVSDGVSLEQSAWKGTLAVGTESDTVRVLLGRILQLTLIDEGFRVVDLVGMGPSERVQQALADTDVDLIWWSGATSGSQSPIAGNPSSVVSSAAIEGWRVIVSHQLAGQLTVPTASSLSGWINNSGEQLQFAATSGLDDESLDEFLSAYGLNESVRSFTRAEALEEVEALLKFGAVDVVIVRSLEETLTISGFLEIADDLGILEQDPISMIIQQSVSTNFTAINEILIALGERLTTEVLHDLVSRIRLLHQEPEDVAREFLQQ